MVLASWRRSPEPKLHGVGKRINLDAIRDSARDEGAV